MYPVPGCTCVHFVSDSSKEEQKIASTALENNYFARDLNDNRDNGINSPNRNAIFEIN